MVLRIKNRKSFVFFRILVTSFVFFTFPASSFSDEHIPQHLIDIWWACRYESKEFKRINVVVDVNGNLEQGKYIYIAPLGKIQINGFDFYGGIQTDIYGWKSKFERSVRKYSNGGIFSKWSKEGQEIDDSSVSGFDGTIYEIANYEGTFASVRNQFRLVDGRYIYSISSKHIDGEYWLEASVIDPDKIDQKIGLISVGKSKPQISGNIASFFEVYGKGFKIPNGLKITYHQPSVDGTPCNSTPTTISPKYSGYNYSHKIIKYYTNNKLEVIYNE